MKTRLLIVAGAALVSSFAVSGARAGEWSGPYIGVHTGAAWSDQKLDLGPASQLAEYFFDWNYLPRSVALDDVSFAGGALAGYNWRSGSLVIGIEADITGVSGDGESEVIDLSVGGIGYKTTASAEVDSLATLRARLGMTVTPRTLVFVTGGLALGHAEAALQVTDVGFVCPNTTSLCLDESKSEWKAGWVVGGGAEFALTGNWSLRGEYLHYDLGSVSFKTTPPPPHDDYIFSTRTDFSGDIARATLNYGF